MILTLLQAAVAGPVLPKEQVRVTPVECRQRAADHPDDILVCAPAPDQFRLKKLPDRYSADAPALPKAETSIFGGKAKLAGETEQGDNPSAPAPRAMIRLKVPF